MTGPSAGPSAGRQRFALLASALLLACAGLAGAGPAQAAMPAYAAVRSATKPVVIGHSVRGRPILAWHLGETTTVDGAPTRTVVLIATMHGDEPAPQQILDALRDGPAVHGLDLWVVPVDNPDGLAAGTRRNAHGVDLNRNFPYYWAPMTGSYDAGPHPASEPETRALMGFLARVRPDTILSFHQPLHGVDADVDRPGFARRVARRLHLPTTTLDCGGVCHGTMTGWYNDRFGGRAGGRAGSRAGGFALTVEYGAHPSRRLMRVEAPREVLSIFPSASR